jgi:hypothetical protein
MSLTSVVVVERDLKDEEARDGRRDAIVNEKCC